MDEMVEISKVVIQEDPILRLRRLMRGGKLPKFVDLLEGIIDDTGFGELTIVVAQAQIQNLKVEKSYRY